VHDEGDARVAPICSMIAREVATSAWL